MLFLSIAMGSALAQGTTSPPAQGKPMPSMAQMDSHMQKMRSLHDKLQKATTAEERRKLMDQHRQAMREGMVMMEPMMGSGGSGGQGMMGGGGQGMMGGQGAQGKSATGEPSMDLMNKRIDMMQMMMQMMMDQQGMSGSPGTPPTK
jgi:hypothetical protein